MKIFTRFILFTIFIAICSFSLLAQTNKDVIFLKSGNYVPPENGRNFSKNLAQFDGAKFNNAFYVVVQFYKIPSATVKENLLQNGIKLTDYLPNNAYVAIVNNNAALHALAIAEVRSVFYLQNEQKTTMDVWNQKIPLYALEDNGLVKLTLLTYENISLEQLSIYMKSLQATIRSQQSLYNEVNISIDKTNIKDLINLPFVQWVEFAEPPATIENLPGRTLHRVNVLNAAPRNLLGNNINVGIWDGGAVDTHLDFLPANRLTVITTAALTDHGTHCSGTILGRGLINPFAKGMAPDAKLFSYDFNVNIPAQQASEIPVRNLIVSSHSYGGTVSSCNINGSQIVYSSTSRNTDLNLNNFPNHLHVHSAGNSQTSCSGGWYTITGSGKTAKNNLLVANIASNETLNSTSSCGPTQDGRVKPEISAMGTNVYSTVLNNAYASYTGTSMATPGVSGSAALLFERYKQLNGNNLPPSTLIKNIILNSAQDLGNVGPDYRFGYGRINDLKAVRILEENRYSIATITNGATQTQTISVPANAKALKVMLTWNDPAGSANASPALVNNLDLHVTNTVGTFLPYVLDKDNPSAAATQAVDNISNIEQVVIVNPAAGTYTANIAGTTIASGNSQDYALTWIIDTTYIEVIYPNGGEKFAPSSTEVITWDNAGITGSQTLEYSLNNGSTWTSIATGLPATTTRFSWAIPAANTSTALIRVSAGGVTDASDGTFKILGATSNLSFVANCSSVQVSWNAVTNATHYDLLLLNTATGTYQTLASNIAATTFSATGLTPNTTAWFAVIAKNNTIGSESERSVAQSFFVPNIGTSISLGNISGATSACGAATNLTYSVAPITGATSYNWTVPAGVTIVNGQGTNSVTLNFSANTVSTISVFAILNTGCNSTTSALQVSTTGSIPTAPISGGNQTQNVCAPNPIPTLTATATVGIDNTVIWYNQNTGGSIVTNPILNTAGTITYYAAAKTPAGCESATRTPVTLTINVAPPAAITASGPITFCEGGSVTLTANSGAAYAWSSGQSTQSITVTTGGNYQVQVTNSNGCVSTSNNITVVVNAAPVNTIITANGSLSFCEGSSVTLTAPTASSYAWSTGAASQNITVHTSGNYQVTLTNTNGCSKVSQPVVVTVIPAPVVTITASPYTKLYPTLTTTLTANANPQNANYQYVWYKNGSALAGNTVSTLVVNASQLGTYKVKVGLANGCDKTSNEIVISDSATNKLFVYPNPSRGNVTIQYYSTSSVATKFEIKVADAKGKLVYTKQFANTIPYQPMNMSLRLSSGIYYITVYNEHQKIIQTEKLLVY